ncbi:NUDIX domain-containing protein [Candidatus Gracilibacteria bacterium]|nr:NUDIX domain-containing protein [Candidatus Gracilibacteria bacterium]
MLGALQHLFDSYISLYPEESLPLFSDQLKHEEEDITSRKNFRGHVVADGCIIDPKNKKILLIHHKTLKRWLNPGGHIDEGENHPADAARREVLEETGVRVDCVLDENREPLLLHIDSHSIPENPKKGEPEHWHHAMTFLFLADSSLALPQGDDEGIIDCQWFDISDALQYERMEDILSKLQLT